jgi:S1-C subfamily serine protease
MWGWGALGLLFASLFYQIATHDDTRYLAATVIIEDQTGHGSGVFISPTQILTAKHVAEEFYGDGLRVRGPEGDIYQVVSASFGPADIAILTVDRPLNGTPLKTSCHPIERGDKFTFFGSPLNIEFAGPFEITFVGGKPIVGFRDTESLAMMDMSLLTNGETEPGVSGAGIIDSSGRVVGVYNFAWNGTTYGGFVSLSYPAVCEFVTRELQPGANA